MRLIYENVAIGLIVQRIGECRAQNNWLSLETHVTQQTPLDQVFRDTLLSYGDKFIIIEFKAPEVNSSLSYEDINLDALSKIASSIGDKNVMLGLIHATLASHKIKSHKKGLYYWWAVPATTVFVPLYSLNIGGNKLSNLKSSKLRLKVLKANNYVRIDRTVTHIPTCAIQSPINKTTSWCASCGGVYEFGGYPRKVLLNIELNGQILAIGGFTLASLIHEMIGCAIGYKITRPEDEESSKIINITQESLSNPAIFIKGKSLQLIPL